MSTPSKEQAFYDALIAAEGVRQSSRATAQATYGFVKSKYAQFVTDLVSADTTSLTSIVTAATAGGINPNVGVAGPIPSSRTSRSRSIFSRTGPPTESSWRSHLRRSRSAGLRRTVGRAAACGSGAPGASGC